MIVTIFANGVFRVETGKRTAVQQKARGHRYGNISWAPATSKHLLEQLLLAADQQLAPQEFVEKVRRWRRGLEAHELASPPAHSRLPMSQTA